MIDKKEFYETRHEKFVQVVTAVTELLLSYPDSRYRKAALEKVEESYLWATQMIHAELANELKKEEIEQSMEEKEVSNG